MFAVLAKRTRLPFGNHETDLNFILERSEFPALVLPRPCLFLLLGQLANRLVVACLLKFRVGLIVDIVIVRIATLSLGGGFRCRLKESWETDMLSVRWRRLYGMKDAVPILTMVKLGQLTNTSPPTYSCLIGAIPAPLLAG